MQVRRCWNCMSDREKVRSPLTGLVYCVSCGIATSGLVFFALSRAESLHGVKAGVGH